MFKNERAQKLMLTDREILLLIECTRCAEEEIELGEHEEWQSREGVLVNRSTVSEMRAVLHDVFRPKVLQ